VVLLLVAHDQNVNNRNREDQVNLFFTVRKAMRCNDEALEAEAHWPLARTPSLLQTSLARQFCVGDVHARSNNRVSSAVGDGSIAIYKVLAD
jgi:thioredoxin reductase